MTNKIEVAVSKEKLYVLEGDFDYETQIENILESFDFKRVKKAMKALNWKYCTSDFKEYIPNIQELKKTAKECLENAIKCNFSETGEFAYAWFTSWIERAYTNMGGYTAHVSISSTNEGPQMRPLIPAYDYYWNGNYSVTHDATGSTVASGHFSIGATARAFAPVVGVMFSEQQTFTIK